MKITLFLFACLLALHASFPVASSAADDEEGPIVDHSILKATLLSMVLPGAGQAYNLQFRKAIGLFICTAAAGTAMALSLTSSDEVGYQLGAVAATVGLYTYTVVDAAHTAAKIRRGELIVAGLSPFVTPEAAGLVLSMKW